MSPLNSEQIYQEMVKIGGRPAKPSPRNAGDDCTPRGEVCGAGDFYDTIVLVGDDGHRVEYARGKDPTCHPIGNGIPALHAGVRYTYTLTTDCGVSNDGLVNGDCGIDHRISMGGRRLEMEDMMGNPAQNYTDLILTLDEGFGTFNRQSSTTGILTIPNDCKDEDECQIR